MVTIAVPCSLLQPRRDSGDRRIRAADASSCRRNAYRSVGSRGSVASCPIAALIAAAWASSDALGVRRGSATPVATRRHHNEACMTWTSQALVLPPHAACYVPGQDGGGGGGGRRRATFAGVRRCWCRHQAMRQMRSPHRICACRPARPHGGFARPVPRGIIPTSTGASSTCTSAACGTHPSMMCSLRRETKTLIH